MTSIRKRIAYLSLLAVSLLSFPAAAASLEASDLGGRAPARIASIGISRVEPVLGSDLAANRAYLLDQLHDYAIAGDFPQNDDTPGGKQMYFLDSQGRPCAVAFLMIQSGRMDDVQAIAARNNAVKVRKNTGGAIANWIRTSGFTVAEIMMIQEPNGYGYMGGDDPTPVVNADRERIQKRLLSVERKLRAASAARVTAGLTES